MGVLAVIAGVLMAVGPPLAYADQFVSICRKHDSRGFSIDVTGILIIANITRLVYWLGDHFQTYLLVQSVLMVIFQYGLLYVCVLYRPENWRDSLQSRPLDFWQWARFGTFLEATAILVVAHAVLFFLLHNVDAYVQLLGFLALGLEATLPIPQVLANYRAKSTAGFRLSVLASWAIGDAVKTVYFFLTPNNPLQFKVCGIFQLSVDVFLCFQTFWYRHETARQLASRHAEAQSGSTAPVEPEEDDGRESLLPQPAPTAKAVAVAEGARMLRAVPPAAQRYDEEQELEARG
ncbi:hypothetical protein JCM8202_003776 [Rhodotorula sphaerocarpa]